MAPTPSFEPGVVYKLTYNQRKYPDGHEIVTKKFKVVEKNENTITVEGVEDGNIGLKYIRRDDIIQANPFVGGRRRSRKTRKGSRKNRKSRRSSRK
jgi:hypothetical protein